jgi:hypothetical protein
VRQRVTVRAHEEGNVEVRRQLLAGHVHHKGELKDLAENSMHRAAHGADGGLEVWALQELGELRYLPQGREHILSVRVHETAAGAERCLVHRNEEDTRAGRQHLRVRIHLGAPARRHIVQTDVHPVVQDAARAVLIRHKKAIGARAVGADRLRLAHVLGERPPPVAVLIAVWNAVLRAQPLEPGTNSPKLIGRPDVAKDLVRILLFRRQPSDVATPRVLEISTDADTAHAGEERTPAEQFE